MYRIKVHNPKLAVPITYMDKYDDDQFILLGKLDGGGSNPLDFAKPIIGGAEL